MGEGRGKKKVKPDEDEVDSPSLALKAGSLGTAPRRGFVIPYYSWPQVDNRHLTKPFSSTAPPCTAVLI